MGLADPRAPPGVGTHGGAQEELNESADMSNSQRMTYERHHLDLGSIIRFGAIALVTAAIVALVLDNRQPIRLGYVLGEATAPAWMVIVVAGIGGVAAAWFVRYRRDRNW